MTGIWFWVANPAASLFFAVLAIIVLIRMGFHRDNKGALTRRRLGSVVGLAASSYTFIVCVVSQLVVKGPSVAELVQHGFGSERIAWLLLILTLDQLFRLWDEYRPAEPVEP